MFSPALYVISRDTLFEQLQVRAAQHERDYKDIQSFITGMGGESHILAKFRKSGPSGTTYPPVESGIEIPVVSGGK